MKKLVSSVVVLVAWEGSQFVALCWLLGTSVQERGKSDLLAENALLRQQLIILRRQVKRPVYRKADRFLPVVLARMVRTWKQALFLVQPERLLHWHRELFRLFSKRKSKARSIKPDPIKGMGSRFQIRRRFLLLHPTSRSRWLPFLYWEGDTMTTEERRKLRKTRYIRANEAHSAL